MDEFINYLKSEFKDKIRDYAAIETKFLHSTTVKNDKKSGVPLKNDIIKVNLCFFDKKMNKLYSTAVNFENNLLNKIQKKKLINISAKELENKFAAAKNEICDVILRDYVQKRNELNEKIDEIRRCKGVGGIIPNEFKGESINVVGSVKKVKFDM